MDPAFERIVELAQNVGGGPVATELVGLVLPLVDRLLNDVHRIADAMERIAGCESGGYFDTRNING